MTDEAQELKIAAMLDALDQEHARVQAATAQLKATGEALRQEVRQAAARSMQEALGALHGELAKAQAVVIDLQRFSLWRSLTQHAITALITVVAIVLIAAWYLPDVSEVRALRAEQAQLKASIEELESRGGRVQMSQCGKKPARLCVRVDPRAGTFGRAENGEVYMVIAGY